MNALASVIRDRFDALLDEYDRRLQEHAAYAEMSAQFRREAARRTLNFVADWLQRSDDTQLVRFIQATAKERAAQGLDIEIMQHAVNALEAILDPLTTDVETAKLVWRTLDKARDAVARQATETLRTSENKLRQMVDRSPVGIYHTTPEGRLADANPAFLKITGYESVEAVNQVGVFGLYQNPADRQRLIELLKQGPVTGFETIFCRADGRVITVSINVRLAQEDGSGQYLEGTLEDVTDRKRTEQALRESEERLRAVVETSQAAVSPSIRPISSRT